MPDFSDSNRESPQSGSSSGSRRALSEGPFLIGGHWVHPTLNRVTVDNRQERIEPKAMQVLLHLAERPGHVVAKEDLLDQVWNGTAVVEKVLTRIISLLRRVFGDDARQPRIIETIPRRGYRLIAPVEVPEGAVSPHRRQRGWTINGSTRRVPGLEHGPSPSSPSSTPQGRFSRARFAVLATLVAAVLVWAAASSLKPPASDSSGYRPIREIAIPWGLACTPVLSPQGRDLAYVHWTDDGSTHLKLQRIGSSPPIVRTRSPDRDFAPAWSPDGQWLAFLRKDREAGSCRLMKIPALAGEEQVLASCPPYYSQMQLNWSPDGKHLVLGGRHAEDAPSRILRFSLQSREMTPITDPPHSALGDSYPEYSPDGRYLAFMRSFGPNRHQLMIRDLDSGRETELGQEEAAIINVAWTSDSRHIVYAAYRFGTFQLFKMPRQGGKAVWLPTQGMKVSMPDISLESNRLVYMTWDFNADIWNLTLAPSGREVEAATPLFKSTGLDYAPALSPDGRQVAFLSQRTGRAQVWIGSRDGAQRRLVGDCGGGLIASLAWSPDGGRIVFPCPASEAEPPSLNIVTLDDGKRTSLFVDEAVEDVVWPAGGAVIYSSRGRTRPQIYRLALSGAVAQPLTQEGATQLRLAPDGRSVYYRRYGSEEIYRLGGPSVPVARLPRSCGAIWGVGQGVLYARGAGNSLQRVDLRSGETAVLKSVDPWPQLGRSPLSVSAQGRILAVEQVLSDSQFMYFDLPRD
ncbi:MAG TPA: LpqB family beta-propeller domain-containing protein [Acidobacteriota bacterium]|nr:LpqB family beta-propeller domain-containing protein [Acidobacteriota bacterium]